MSAFRVSIKLAFLV